MTSGVEINECENPVNQACTIARARPADAPALTHIAHTSKRHWGYPERWIELWRDALTITPEYISAEPVFAARVNGEPCGFYGLLHKPDELWLEHLWVLPAHMGRGIGGALVAHAKETAFAQGASLLKIESDPNAEDFYLRRGAERIGQRISEIEGHQRVLPLLMLHVRL